MKNITIFGKGNMAKVIAERFKSRFSCAHFSGN